MDGYEDLPSKAKDSDPYSDIPASTRTTFAETGGGAAVGRPVRGRMAERRVTPFEAAGAGFTSKLAGVPISAAQLATGGRVGTETAKKFEQEMAPLRKEYPGYVKAGEIAGDIAEYGVLGGAGRGLGLMKEGAGLGRRLAEQAAIGGTMAAAQPVTETKDMYGEAIKRGAVGAAFGAGAEVGATKLGEQLSKLGDLSETRRALVNVAEKFGIRLTPGEITGNPMLRSADRLYSYIPFTAGQVKKINETNERKIAETVLKAMGTEGSEVNQTALGLAKKGIQQRYNDVLQNTRLNFDKTLRDEIGQIGLQNEARNYLSGSKAARVIRFLDSKVDDTLTGAEYNEIRSAIGDLAASTSDDVIARNLYQLQRAVDKTAERTINKYQGTVEDFLKSRKEVVDNLKALRKQYTVFQDVFDAFRHKGMSPEGGLSLDKLYDAVNRRRPERLHVDVEGRELLPTEELARLQTIKGEPLPSGIIARTIPWAVGAGGIYSPSTVLPALGAIRGSEALLYSKPATEIAKYGAPTATRLSPEAARALGTTMGEEITTPRRK